MSAFPLALAIFIVTLGSAFVGLALHVKLPDHHLDGNSKDVVKLVIGLVATMAALVLGLLIASAQSNYSTQSGNVQQLAADVVQLDHILDLYGPEADDARRLLRQAVGAAHDRIWSNHGIQAQNLDPSAIHAQSDRFFFAVASLAPKTEAQQFAKNQAMQVSASAGQMRALMFQESRNAVSWPFLLALTFWLSVLFLGFGLLARFHATVAAALLIGSLSVSAAIFLILELGSPYSGIIQISDAPIRMVLAQPLTAGQ